jgi:hypothetical protein
MASSQPDPTRKELKVFGVAVTDFQDQSAELLRRYRTASSIGERERLLRESAELTAGLHHALARIESKVLQLQSDFLMELVAREDAPGGG